MQPSEVQIDYTLLSQFDVDLLIKYECMPFKKDDFYTYFFVSSDVDIDNIFNVVSKTYAVSSKSIRFFLSDLNYRISLYQGSIESIKSSDTQQNSMNTFVNQLLEFAIEKKCSDIHIETQKESVLIRFRIDGALKRFFHFDKALYSMLSSIIKLKCTLDITQLRKPLNGRFNFSYANRSVDFRVSTMPTILGESIVLRLLEDEFEYQTLQNLGFEQNQYEKIVQGLNNKQGLIIVTGPTGSGKTTTLYSILHQLNAEEKKIITIEDPIEYQLEGIQQIAVNEALGLTFDAILKDILRQDPDIVMVGEIRDAASLQIALQASLTGHLVLTTLHTNDAISTLYRLFDLQAKPYIIASALKMILAQRLVLKQCSCEEGCSHCNYTSFDGRVGICEVLNVNDELAQMIVQQSSKEEVLQYLKKQDFIKMHEDAIQKIEKGITTKEEVLKVLGEFDEVL